MKKEIANIEALNALIKQDPELSRTIDKLINKAVENPTFGFGGPRGMDMVGQALKRQRELLDIKQRDMAKSLGYGNAQFLSNIERGTAKIPLEKIGTFLAAYQITDEMFQPAVIYLTHRKMWPTILNILSAANVNSESFDERLTKWIKSNML